jgi:hypothetical protein
MAPDKTKGESRAGSVAIINAVKTPLNFFVLVVLVVEGGLGGLALKSPANLLTIVYLMVAVLIALVLAVVAMAVLKPELVVPGHTHGGSPQTRRFLERIAGQWWEVIEPREPTAVSLLEISPNPAAGNVRMTGEAYSEAGEFVATWESVAAWVNVDERKVFYAWRGRHSARAKEGYEGFGEISFYDSLESGDGVFFDINISDWASTRKMARLMRASREELEVMRNGRPKAIEGLFKKRFHMTA